MNSSPGCDVLVVGNGVIGLTIALELADRGATCRVLGGRHRGGASDAAAGLIAPSIGRLSAAVRPFFYRSLDRFPVLLARLQEADSTLRVLEGVIEIGEAPPLRHIPVEYAPRELDETALAALEPALRVVPNARFYPRDGAVDNVRLVAALRRVVGASPAIDFIDDEPALRLESTRPGVRIVTAHAVHHAARVVLAAGAWTPLIEGLPRELPVIPLKGQMLAIRRAPLQHAVAADGAYLVPRGPYTVVGATTEHAGFDMTTTGAAVAMLRAAALGACPSLAEFPLDRAWAGIRPATPDMLPLLGVDPDNPAVVYACGHSKNGILLAPATAEAIAALVAGSAPPVDISAFRVDRFD